MKFPKKILIALFAATQLTACQWLSHTGISDQEKAYGNAKSEAPLAIPADLPNTKIGTKTETPPAVAQTQIFKTIPVPPGSLTEKIKTGQVPATVLSQPLPKAPK